jgi:hypothetical protein
MPKEYRIYPGIGIGRLGNSPDGFFLAPEIPNVGPIELDPQDAVVPVTQYKDGNHLLRRQAVRFRVFAVDVGADGLEALTEITVGNGVEIEWQVELANEKSAAGKYKGEDLPEDATHPRNPDAAEADLIIRPTFPKIAGINQTVRASVEGKFKGKEVYLGELRTDHKGRLMVLGGRGISASVPPGQPVGGGTQSPGHDPNSFANNWGWHDDVSDGPVSAVVRVAGQADQKVTQSSWMIVAPPDFAPYTNGITTLFDIAVQAAKLPPPTRPSFQKDVFPILQATSGLQWVSSLPRWRAVSTDYVNLSTTGTPPTDKLRNDTLKLVRGIQGGALQNYRLTANQDAVLQSWADGSFVADYQPAPAQEGLTAAGLDRASLTQGVGGGFFPGIEAGILMTSSALYSAAFRITNKQFEYAGVTQIPHAGFITRTMACPWQSDFYECEMQSVTSAWWPSQRPINVFIENAAGEKDWADSIPDHQALVDKFWMLGLVKKPTQGGKPMLEGERDPSVPHL